MNLVERLAAVRQRVEDAARAAGRDPSAIEVVAVSKFQPPERVEEAYWAGQRVFGENYVQELVSKRDALAHLTDLRWYLIGHLQSNKARLAAELAHRIETVDSEKLAARLEDTPYLVQVLLGGEPTKAGVRPEALPALLAVIGDNPNFKGLMAIPPPGSPDETRHWFATLRKLRDEAEISLGRTLPVLSMGMSADFEVAIAEGSTAVRVGTSIFGPRPGG